MNHSSYWPLLSAEMATSGFHPAEEPEKDESPIEPEYDMDGCRYHGEPASEDIEAYEKMQTEPQCFYGGPECGNKRAGEGCPCHPDGPTGH